MKRREFIFTSLKAAALLSPVFSIRRAEAQQAIPRRLFVWVASAGYPDENAFFSNGQENNWQLGEILANCAPVKQNMVVIDGVEIRNSGYNAAGANHARAPGKVVTAADVIDDGGEGLPGGISIDQFVAQRLNASALEVNITDVEGRSDESIRERPFATGPGQFKVAIKPPSAAWDRVFGGFVPPTVNTAEREAQLRRLTTRRSVLDGMGRDLRRLRAELSGVEKLKLDVHEDSIRRAERSVAIDLGNVPPPLAACGLPARPTNEFSIFHRINAHFDTMHAAFACNRVQVGSMVWGGSGFGWRYDWLPNTNVSDLHNDVHHEPVAQRDLYIRCARYDWQALGEFVLRLRNTPEGDGTMLDHTLVLGISHFGGHHDIRRLPVVLFTGERFGLRTNRYLKFSSPIQNDKVLTSVAQLMGAQVNGFGDDQSCGVVPGLV
jgi:hypothetical protein